MRIENPKFTDPCHLIMDPFVIREDRGPPEIRLYVAISDPLYLYFGNSPLRSSSWPSLTPQLV